MPSINESPCVLIQTRDGSTKSTYKNGLLLEAEQSLQRFGTYPPNDAVTIKNEDVDLIEKFLFGVAEFDNVGC